MTSVPATEAEGYSEGQFFPKNVFLHRKKFLDAADIQPPISTDLIDIFIYGLAPRRFAAASYLYFEAHGCETVTEILNGGDSFRFIP